MTIVVRHLSGDEIVLDDVPTIFHVRVHVAMRHACFASRVRILSAQTSNVFADGDTPPELVCALIVNDDNYASVDENCIVAHALCGDIRTLERAKEIFTDWQSRANRAILRILETNVENIPINSNEGFEVLAVRTIPPNTSICLPPREQIEETTTVCHLLATDADVSEPNARGWTALALASTGGNTHIVNALINKRACVNAVCAGGWTATHCAANARKCDTLCLLLAAKADVNRSNCYGERALGLACRKGHFDTVKTLIDGAAAVNSHSDGSEGHQFPPLYCAAGNGHLGVVELLLANKADVNRMSGLLPPRKGGLPVNRGDFALYPACSNGHLDVVHVLLEARAYCMYVTYDGSTVLHAAAHKGHEDVIMTLLDKHRDRARLEWLNVQDWMGESALLRAVFGHHSNIAQLLVDANADIMLEDAFGETAYDVSYRAKDFKMMEILQAAGASVRRRRRGKEVYCSVQ